MTAFTPPIRRINRGKGHSYVDAAGVSMPGVTTILSNGVPKPALVNWAANTTAGYAVDHWDDLGQLTISERLKSLQGARYADRDAAANRGTAVHALAERLTHGEQVQVPDELAGHVDAYVKFLDEWQVEPIVTERTVASYKYGYAGTFDLVANLPGTGRTWLLDIKTSRSGVFGEVALQLAAYRYADVYVDTDGNEVPMPQVDACGVIHVRADGYDLVPVKAGPAQLRSFLYVQQVAQFCGSSRELIGDALAPMAATS